MKRIAILGTAPTSRDLAPFDDPEWDIWVCSAGNQGLIKRVTRWFELHALVELVAPENAVWALPHFTWLNSQTFPIFMQEKNDLIPRAEPFKMFEKNWGADSLEAKFRKPGFDLLNWVSSQITMMLAHAIAEITEAGQGEIAIFGVDMAADQEFYTQQKAGCWRMLEIAAERGIPVKIPRESCLGRRPPIYGYNEATPMGRRMNSVKHMVMGKRAEMDALRTRYNMEIAYFDGALEQINYFIRTWVDGSDAELDIGPVEARIAAMPAPPVPIEMFAPSAIYAEPAPLFAGGNDKGPELVKTPELVTGPEGEPQPKPQPYVDRFAPSTVNVAEFPVHERKVAG